jgi:hypothetical protein
MPERLVDWLWGTGVALMLLVALCFATSHSQFIYVDF